MSRNFKRLAASLLLLMTCPFLSRASELETGWDSTSSLQPVDVSRQLDEIEQTAAQFLGKKDDGRTQMRETLAILAAYDTYANLQVRLDLKDRTIAPPDRELRKHVYLPGIRELETYAQMRRHRQKAREDHAAYFGEKRNTAAADDAIRITKRIDEIGKLVATKVDERLKRRHDLFEGRKINSIRELRELAERRRATLEPPAPPSDRKRAIKFAQQKRAYEHGRKMFTRLWQQQWRAGEARLQQERMDAAIAALPAFKNPAAASTGGGYLVVFRVHTAYTDGLKPPLKVSHDDYIAATTVDANGLKYLKARNAKRNFGWRRNSGNSIERPFAHYERSSVTYLKVIELSKERGKKALNTARDGLAALGPHHRFRHSAYAGPMNLVRTEMVAAPKIAVSPAR